MRTTIDALFLNLRHNNFYSRLNRFICNHTFVYAIVIVTLTLLGGYLRFYNLNWGQPFLHPDEFNIGYAISHLEFPNQLNPHFFAYGSFPIYLTYGLGVLSNMLSNTENIWHVSASHAILIGRYISATLSTLLIPLLFTLSRYMGFSKLLSLNLAILATGMIGFIQYAHFATFEIFLTFFYCLILVIAIKTIQQPTAKHLILLSVLIGLSIGIKIVSIFLITLLPLVLLAKQLPQTDRDGPRLWRALLLDTSVTKLVLDPKTWLYLIVIIIAFTVTNPFTFIDWHSFVSSMQYERGVADGSLPVFYTRSFLDSRPGIYQLQHILPFVSGYLFTLVSVLSLVITVGLSFRTRLLSRVPLFALLTIFGGYLALHLSMYVKWTRYMVPALPLLLVSFGIMVQWILNKTRYPAIRITTITIVSIITLEILLRGLSFFQIYRLPDTRVVAGEWLSQHIDPTAIILSELYDPGIMPTDRAISNQIVLFNMYDYDTHNNIWSPATLADELARTDYIIIPSRRIYVTAHRHPHLFPRANQYYESLFSGELGFELTYTSEPQPCLLPTYIPFALRTLGCPINDEQAEETFVVFDHPTMRIYKKHKQLSPNEYLKILTGNTHE